MSSLAIALVLARVKKLESELISLDGNLQTLLKNVKQVEERKEHIKRQLNNAKLQTTHLKIWRLP
jgi:chromosome segregation ATPase